MKKQGVDVRTVLVSYADPTPTPFCQPGRGVCVPEPTGSATCPGQTTEFLHVGKHVDSNPLQTLLDTYDTWRPRLRPNAPKVFLIVSNDKDYGFMTAETFKKAVSSLAPPLGNTWSLSGVLCAGAMCNAAQLQCGPLYDPAARCVPNELFASLVTQTGGFAVDFCTTDPPAASPAIVSGLLEAANPPGCP